MIYNAISDSLGGVTVLHKEIKSEIDLFSLVETGIPKKAAEIFAPVLGFGITTLVESFFNVSVRSFQRKHQEDLLGSSESESLLRLAEVYARGMEVFNENKDELTRWLFTKNIPLGDKKPIDLMKNGFGVQLVLERLDMMEYGMF